VLEQFQSNSYVIFVPSLDQTSLFTSSEEDSSMAIETSATQQSRRPRHNPENNNPLATDDGVAQAQQFNLVLQ
jgi:hypothetical protein